jgi:hypothetical protein
VKRAAAVIRAYLVRGLAPVVIGWFATVTLCAVVVAQEGNWWWFVIPVAIETLTLAVMAFLVRRVRQLEQHAATWNTIGEMLMTTSVDNNVAETLLGLPTGYWVPGCNCTVVGAEGMARANLALGQIASAGRVQLGVLRTNGCKAHGGSAPTVTTAAPPPP